MLSSLFYISRCALTPARKEQAVGDIVRQSRARNPGLRITGALLYSGSHFVQFLEGPEQNVHALMGSIARDPRHRDISVLLEQRDIVPRFSGWCLAYSGQSTFVQRRLDLLLSPPSQRSDADKWDFLAMMRQFATG